LVASSDGAPASSGGKAAAASSSSSRPFNFFFIAGYRVPSPDDLLDHRDNTKLQALCWLASLVKSKVSEGWYHHLDDDDNNNSDDDNDDDNDDDYNDDASATHSRCYFCCHCYILSMHGFTLQV
jgi:hypothetical protein